MQKLNIPLSRHTKTTRPLGQVVWLVVVLILILLFVSWKAGELWFSRDSILQAAPVGTILAIQLELTDQNWSTLQTILQNVPLISNRSLDINDLVPFANGDIALFVTKTGERSVAMRTDEQHLPRELLNSLSVTTQEVAPGIFLLSQTLLPISGIHSKARHPILLSLFSHWLGRVELPDMDLSGSLFQKNGHLEIHFSTKKHKGFPKTDLPQTMLALSANSNDGSWPSGEQFEVFSRLLTENWEVFVQETQSGTPDLLLSTDKGDMGEDELLDLLQIMGAYLSPKIQESQLPDGSTLAEILVEPGLVTVEEVQIGTQKALRVLGEGEQSIYGAFVDDKIVLATSMTALSTYTQPWESNLSCGGNILHLDPSALLKTTSMQTYSPPLQILQSLFVHFSAISLEMNKYSSTMTFCST